MAKPQPPPGTQGHTANVPSRIPSIRFGPPHRVQNTLLGPLAELAGNWSGTGFNLIARPNAGATPPSPFFLELNLTNETLTFSPIGSGIPNRGDGLRSYDDPAGSVFQKDIQLSGLTYLQQINDATTGGGLHIEPGIWINIPQTTNPSNPASIARMGSVPHGVAFLATGTASGPASGPPTIPLANTIPFGIGGTPPSYTVQDYVTKNPFASGAKGIGTPGGFEYNLNQANEFRTPADLGWPIPPPPPPPYSNFSPPSYLPPQITQDVLADPNSILRSAIANQVITETTTLSVQTVLNNSSGAGGAANIPFLVSNADAIQVSATFWIETVQVPINFDGNSFLQLQYSQTVLLNFTGFSWPHVSVATLTLGV